MCHGSELTRWETHQQAGLPPYGLSIQSLLSPSPASGQSQRSWLPEAEVSIKWLVNVAKSLWCAKYNNNSAVQKKAEVLVMAVRAIVPLMLLCMNLVCIGSCNVLVFIAPECLSFGSFSSAPRKAGCMESGLFHYCKKEKHKMTEINGLTSETNKCSSCLHYPEVFDIPNYDITVGVIVAAVAFVKWSVMPHANK